ncbi:hypothetical protein [Methylocystis iwaonis]|uniref:hypothetical protein n=1 Tax=Methylocystis iwaonis TaxID=2885079 RepID=UPI002491455B|nr:hypothetical protein [Methylocystis iwaonis]
MVVYAQQQGVTSYTGVAEKAWFEQIQNFGWKCRALGPCNGLEPTALVALQIEIEDDTLARLQDGGVYAPCQFRTLYSRDVLNGWEMGQ